VREEAYFRSRSTGAWHRSTADACQAWTSFGCNSAGHRESHITRTSTVRVAAHVRLRQESAPVPIRARQTKEGVHVRVRVDGRSRGSCRVPPGAGRRSARSSHSSHF
jgi:hypothetical protein